MTPVPDSARAGLMVPSDETVYSYFETFRGDLSYWASTLSEFKGRWAYLAHEQCLIKLLGNLGSASVGHYIHELSKEIGERP